MSILFVSDLHLDPTRPAMVALFEQFLATEARHAKALYMLGDLFESWIGDDDESEPGRRVAANLHQLRVTGLPIFFIAGNRDFLLGADYAARSGMQILDDGTVVDLYGTPTLLMHGDTLCTDDIAYQAFRAVVRDPQWQKRFLSRPLDARRAYAAEARTASRKHTQEAALKIMDVNTDAVAKAMRDHGVKRLIHGHTHRPARHVLTIDGEDAERIVLGDWYRHGSVLRVDASSMSLEPWPAEPAG